MAKNEALLLSTYDGDPTFASEVQAIEEQPRITAS